MNDSFAQSRAELRTLLGMDAASPGAAAEWRPRSRLLRAALNPDNRAVFLAVAAVASLAFPRLARTGALYPLVSKIAQAGRHLSKMRLRR